MQVAQVYRNIEKRVVMSGRKSENELLTIVSKFAYSMKDEDQMALSAAFMVAAKTIYINQLGMEQTQDLFQAMADSMGVFEIEKITLH